MSCKLRIYISNVFIFPIFCARAPLGPIVDFIPAKGLLQVRTSGYKLWGPGLGWNTEYLVRKTAPWIIQQTFVIWKFSKFKRLFSSDRFSDFLLKKWLKTSQKRGLASGVQQRSIWLKQCPLPSCLSQASPGQLALKTPGECLLGVPHGVRFRRLPGMLWCDKSSGTPNITSATAELLRKRRIGIQGICQVSHLGILDSLFHCASVWWLCLCLVYLFKKVESE